jgi:hypothetical protein
MNEDILKNIGFRDVGTWKKADNGKLRYEVDSANFAYGAMLDVRNALYAFVQNEEVMYIGKTTRSIRRRFFGYCNPGSTQQTNKRCHRNIQELLGRGISVRILVCTPPSELSYGDFQIDLAAGLEESLILKFDPPWNGREGPRPITEEAERETIEEEPNVLAVSESPIRPSSPTTFRIKLGDTYYNRGLINPGARASEALGQHGEPLIVYLGSKAEQVDSSINRAANSNGSVRIIGNNARIGEWFRENFQMGDTVESEVQSPNHILLKEQGVGDERIVAADIVGNE